MPSGDALSSLLAPRVDRDSFRVETFDLARDGDRARLTAAFDAGRVHYVHDDLEDLLGELVALGEPTRKLSSAETAERVRTHLQGAPLERYGVWVLYPWSGRLVHCLPEREHRAVRTDRNRYKLTAAEQEKLRGCRVGVIGLSVGNMAAVTLALEGVGGAFRLADFDRLSLSNLNRLRGGVQDLGAKKTTLAAREIAELDPFLEVELFPEGVRDDNLDAFLDGIDLLVEECDDLALKVLVRRRARELRIPVVMDTSDRGLLDVERFDLEPERPIFHGLLGDVDPTKLRGLPSKDKVPFFLAIVDADRMSARMAASLPEIEKTISTWPQLASGVALGGAITTDVARRILLGTHRESGRYYVDPETIVADGAAAYRAPAAAPPPRRTVAEARDEPALPPRPARPARGARAVDEAGLRFVAAHALLAPSAHNTQPWRLVCSVAGATIDAHHDARHDLTALDFAQTATDVAFGALLENVALAAGAIGLDVDVAEHPAPGVVFRATLRPGEGEEDPLFAWIPRRLANRRRDRRVPLAPAHAASLEDAALSRGARLQLATSDAALDELAAVLGEGDRLTLLDRALHADFFSGFRWSADEVEKTRDGLDLDVLELTESERAGLLVLRQWRVMETLGSIGGGRALEDLARSSVAASSAVGLLTVPGIDRSAYLRGGRAAQRVWLTASSLGLALHPWTGLPHLLARAERGGRDGGFTDAQRAELASLRRRLAAVFVTSPDHAEAFLFRLSVPEGPPTARSLRRRFDDLVTFV